MMLKVVRKGNVFRYVRTGEDIIVIGYDENGNIGVLVDKAEIVNMAEDRYKELIESLQLVVDRIKEFRKK